MTGNTIESVLKSMHKSHGDSIAVIGSEVKGIERLETGWFPFDLASGGGFPVGRISIIYGPESSGKSNLAMRAISSFQSKYPDQWVVFLDIENCYDAKWAELMGVDNERVVVAQPGYAEQAVDMLESFLSAEDVGLLVVDSIAQLVPVKEAEESAERIQVGGNAYVVGKMMRKLLISLAEAKKNDRYPTLLLINQLRYKIGMMYGNPETMPGGKALFHAAALIVKTYGKDIVVKEVRPDIPVIKKTSITFTKWKIPIFNKACEYEMVSIPHNGFPVGHVDDWKLMQGYLKTAGILAKEGVNWVINGPWIPDEKFKNLDEVRQRIMEDYELGVAVRKEIYAYVQGDSSLPEKSE